MFLELDEYFNVFYLNIILIKPVFTEDYLIVYF